MNALSPLRKFNNFSTRLLSKVKGSPAPQPEESQDSVSLSENKDTRGKLVSEAKVVALAGAGLALAIGIGGAVGGGMAVVAMAPLMAGATLMGFDLGLFYDERTSEPFGPPSLLFAPAMSVGSGAVGIMVAVEASAGGATGAAVAVGGTAVVGALHYAWEKVNT